MRLVAGALQQLERRAAARQPQRLGLRRQEHFFLALREAHDGQGLLAERTRRVEGGAELPLAPVDHHQVRERLRFGDAPRQVPRHHLVHRREVVLRGSGDAEPAVLDLLGPAGLEPDQRPHRVAPLIGRNVDAHERARHGGEPQIASQREHGVGRALVDVEALDLEAVQQVAGVLIGELGELRVGAPLRHVPLHFRRELLERLQILGREREQRLPSPHLERQVAADQEGRQYGTLGLVLGILEEPVIPRDQLAVAHP